jgi:hypothetical protein
VTTHDDDERAEYNTHTLYTPCFLLLRLLRVWLVREMLQPQTDRQTDKTRQDKASENTAAATKHDQKRSRETTWVVKQINS